MTVRDTLLSLRRTGSAAALLGVCLALAACGSSKPGSDSSDVADDPRRTLPCAIEIEFARSATQEQIGAFRRRVERIPQAARVEILSRQQNIERFIAQLRQLGYSGEQFDALAARARNRAGVLLVMTPREMGDIHEILNALQELPAAVSSVVDRESCDKD